MSTLIRPITYELSDHIPEQLTHIFCIEASASSSVVYGNKIHFVAKQQDAIIGFTSAKRWNNLLAVKALYVDPSYRRRGIAKRLIYKMLSHARQEHLRGITLDEMLFATKYLMEGLQRRQSSHPCMSIDLSIDEGSGYCCEIRFNTVSSAKNNST